LRISSKMQRRYAAVPTTAPDYKRERRKYP